MIEFNNSDYVCIVWIEEKFLILSSGWNFLSPPSPLFTLLAFYWKYFCSGVLMFYVSANGTVAHYGGGLSDDAMSLSVQRQSILNIANNSIIYRTLYRLTSSVLR